MSSGSGSSSISAWKSMARAVASSPSVAKPLASSMTATSSPLHETTALHVVIRELGNESQSVKRLMCPTMRRCLAIEHVMPSLSFLNCSASGSQNIAHGQNNATCRGGARSPHASGQIPLSLCNTSGSQEVMHSLVNGHAYLNAGQSLGWTAVALQLDSSWFVWTFLIPLVLLPPWYSSNLQKCGGGKRT